MSFKLEASRKLPYMDIVKTGRMYHSLWSFLTRPGYFYLGSMF